MQRNKDFSFIILFLVLTKILIHIPTLLEGGYGIFRDELYYLACAAHMSSGYVDQPPLSIWVLSSWISLFGDHWQVIRIVPVIFGGLTMLIILNLVQEMGGGRLAIFLAGAAFLSAPINIAFASYYSMNSLDLFFWALCFYSGYHALEKPGKDMNWVILGVVVGLGLMNKISIAWFAIGFILWLILSPDRVLILTRKPYIAGILALLLFSPFIIWNVQHDMAHITFAQNASAMKYAGISRSDFLSGIVMLENPLGVLMIIPALFFLFNPDHSRAARSAMVIFIITLIILLVKGQVKSEYMAGSFAAVFVSGSIQLESWASAKWPRTVLYFYVLLILVTAVLLLPMASPVLEEHNFIAYQEKLGIKQANNESKEEAQLPQFFADMHGWEELARTISGVYLSIPEAERESAVVWANNYGEAGALDYYRDQMPLPPVLSPHNNYYYWSLNLTSQKEFQTFIIIGGEQSDHEKFLRKVARATIHTCTFCMPYENNLSVYVGTKPFEGMSIQQIIIQEKSFN